jgi:hypothetical protein
MKIIYMHAAAQHVSFFLISPFPVFLFSFDFVVSFDVRVLWRKKDPPGTRKMRPIIFFLSCVLFAGKYKNGNLLLFTILYPYEY